MLIIYGSDLSSPSNKVRFAANALGMEHDYQRINIREGEHQSPKYLKFHPAGKVPAIDDGGFILFESNAIIKYLAQKQQSDLYPADIKKRALVDQWMDFSSIHIGGALNRVIFNRVFAPLIKVEVDERSLNDGLNFLKRFLPVVDGQLTRQAFLVEGTLTLADICLLAILDPAEVAGYDLTPYPGIVKWRNNLKQQEFYTRCYKEYGESMKQPSNP